MNTIKYLFVHHVGGTEKNPLYDSSNQTFEFIDEYHRQRWNGMTYSTMGHYIGYQYFIDRTGKLTQGRSDFEEGAHTIGFNTESIGICLAGNFDLTLPTEAQIKTLTDLLVKKKVEFNVPLKNIFAHRAFANKTCYGKRLYDTWARDLVVKHFYSQISVLLSLVLKLQDRLRQITQPVGSIYDKECDGCLSINK